MVKVVTISVVVILAVSSGASAQLLTQSQNWNFGLGNTINFTGSGSAGTLQGLTALNTQSIGTGLGTMGAQNFDTALLQIGSTGNSEDTVVAIGQATPLIQSVDGLGSGMASNGSLLNLGQMPSGGMITSPYEGTSAPFGISTDSIPWDTEGTGGLARPW